ncbi:adenylate/guanylate cyclase domain-containing protein [Azospirillum sp. SYSU D00513]|uniref:adenylate/guanylate cyclase domain-containing protein n=1 Tax=Azospirillum sp. SYSU D00513 TaxID=2812561 RepID=UPI001A970B21|nr:adenylate/guanylate cyclase domain-containing protein [Azospirillum sp. SYSU D00513]
MADPTPNPSPKKPARRFLPRLHLSVATVLVAGFGSLMLLAVASVLVLGLVSAGRNTITLGNDKADLALAGVEVRVRNQLNPARDMAKFIAEMVERGELAPDGGERVLDTLRGSLAAVPQVTGLALIGPELTGVQVGRQDGSLRTKALDLRGEPDLPPEMTDAADRTAPSWADPLWSKEAGTSFVTLFHPIHRDGRYLGQVMVGVSLGDLSRFLSNLYVEQGINAFVLFDRGHVLAHPSLEALKFDFTGKTDGPPLPRVDQLDDPPLAALWNTQDAGVTLTKRILSRIVTVAGEEYLFLLRPMPGYGKQDWTIGIRFREQEVDTEIRRLRDTALAGFAILLVSVAAALVVGRRISRQVARLAEAADRVRAFDFNGIQELPDSRLRELSRAAAAFNAMVAGLRWFETYVPKALVLRLMHRSGDGAAFGSEERDVTVMFTDIRGFSQLAEHLGAADTAALLNEHFTQLADCIEAEGGTVDKFIGDSIMAFWNAPEEQEDHAARALRAAHAITRAVGENNRRREAAGLAPIRVRVGLHSGPVVVGNIGSASRINYTIVGETVNIAARMSELASALQGQSEVIVLTSAATAAQGIGAAPLARVGGRSLRGRTDTTEVWRMELEGEAAPAEARAEA